MNREVFLSLLALDSYNRGYGANLGIGWATRIGQAKIGEGAETILSPGQAQAAGFYAIAYEWNGQTVISYRGTNFDINWTPDQFLQSPAVADMWNGWTLGAGFASASQGQLAINFYEAVTGVSSIYDTNGGTTILTGHSLGGGLAGFVGALGRVDSVGFDHMPFLKAAQAQAIHVAVSRARRVARARLARPSGHRLPGRNMVPARSAQILQAA